MLSPHSYVQSTQRPANVRFRNHDSPWLKSIAPPNAILSFRYLTPPPQLNFPHVFFF